MEVHEILLSSLSELGLEASSFNVRLVQAADRLDHELLWHRKFILAHVLNSYSE